MIAITRKLKRDIQNTTTPYNLLKFYLLEKLYAKIALADHGDANIIKWIIIHHIVDE